VTTFFFDGKSYMFVTMNGSDLSKFHEPVGRAFNGGDNGGCPVSEDQASFFDANGYLAGIELLTQVQLNELRSELGELMTPKYAHDPRFYEYHLNESTDEGKTLFHALGAWRVSPVFHDLIFFPPIVRAAERLLGGPVRFWHDQLFVKPARDGAVVAWHQDYSYWTRTKPVAHLTCWIGLDDSTVDNGCVHYVPGSHLWNLLPRTDLANDMNTVLGVLSENQLDAFAPVSIEMKAGYASFHHPMMLHGSYENRSNRPRRATVINFIRDGVVSDTEEPLLAGVPVIAKGEKIDGQFFPLISRITADTLN